MAADVVGGVGLRVAELLRLRERLGVAPALAHRREDEVRRAVDDPEHPVDVRHDERLAERLDHGDRRADRGLEPELGARARRRCEELGAPARDELLVRRHDRAARLEQREDVRPRRLEPAHHLGDEADRRVAEDVRGIGREDAWRRGERALLLGLPHERAHDPEPVAGRALDLVGLVRQQPVDGRPDGPVAEQCYGNVNRRHSCPRAA